MTPQSPFSIFSSQQAFLAGDKTCFPYLSSEVGFVREVNLDNQILWEYYPTMGNTWVLKLNPAKINSQMSKSDSTNKPETPAP